ncbi:signal peptidase I [Actinomycetes bacterium M1A6_2h]
MTGSRGRFQETALTVGALLGLLCIAAAMAAMLFGITPLVFRSGSMSPTVTTGSVALGHDIPATNARVGDIVSVDRADGSRITHRVQSIESVAGNSVTLTLKGDANPASDPSPYIVTTVTKVVAHVPYLGYFVAWLSTPFAWATGAVLSLSLVWIAFRPHSPSAASGSPRHGRHSKSQNFPVVAPIVLVAVVASVVGIGFSRSHLTAAAVTDSAFGRAAVTVGFLPGPTTFTCTNRAITGVNLTFASNDPRFKYEVRYSNGMATDVRGPAATGTNFTVTPPVLSLGLGTTTATLVATYNSFVSAPLTRAISTTVVLASCATQGSTSTRAQSARVAQAPAAGPLTSETSAGATTAAPTASTAPTTPAPNIATAAPSTSTTTAVTTVTPPITTTTVPSPPTTTTTPPPPADAFIPAGSSRSSGPNTASIADGQLTVTDGSGAPVLTRPATTSAKYGTGVVWSATGDLYVLSESAGPVKISPTTDGTWAASTVDPSALPADIAALV